MSVQRLGPDADPRVLLRTLATGPVRMVIAAGPRAGAAMTALAPTLPRQRFTWLAGAASGADPAASLPANLSRYRLRVAEPAWLAGLLAAGVSRTRVIAIETLALGTADSPAPAPAIATAPGRSPDPVTAAFGEAARKADPAVRLIEMVTSGHPAADRDRPGETLPVQLAQARHAGADVLLTRADARDATVRQALAASGLRVIVLDPDGSSPLEPAPWLAGRLVIDEAPLIEAIFQDAADSVWRGGLERSVGLRQSALLRVEPATGTGSELLATIEQASLDLMARRIDPLGPGGATTRRGRP
jgi:basic membrane lipoprotein Med (substrate-binding protein (PBP1-ABC) superfamily)